MIKILITATHYSELCPKAKEFLQQHGYQLIENKTELPYFTLEELTELIPDVDGAIVGLDIWNEQVFKVAKKLKVIAKFGVGVDTIDIIKAKEYGIKVINAKGRNSNAVAELAVFHMLGAFRNITSLNKSIRRGFWERATGHEIAGMNIGLIGFGLIAQNVARKLSCFDVNILANDKYPNYGMAKELNVKMVSFEEVLSNSDIISLHVPGSKENYHIIREEQFNMMKDGAYLINTARGNLVDEEALYKALSTNKLSGAAIDVYEEEPTTSENRLFELDNIICTPHIAAETYEAYTAVSMVTAQGVIDVLEGRIPENWLNP